MKKMTFQLADEELKFLESYCGGVERAKTDVLRALIQGLKLRPDKRG